MLAAGMPGCSGRPWSSPCSAAWASPPPRRCGGAGTRRSPCGGGRLRICGTPRTWRRRPWAAGLVLLAGLALGWQLVVALVLPPYAYDALTYHLTTVATWVQHGDVAPSPLSLCCAYYPATPELLIAFPVPLQGSDVLVNTVQVPFVLLGAVATAGLARTAGSRRSAAAAAGALFAVTPTVLTQAPTDYVDVLQTALVLAALHSVTRFAVSGSAAGCSWRAWPPAWCSDEGHRPGLGRGAGRGGGRRPRARRPAGSPAARGGRGALVRGRDRRRARRLVVPPQRGDDRQPAVPVRRAAAGAARCSPDRSTSGRPSPPPRARTHPARRRRPELGRRPDFRGGSGAYDYQQRLGGLGPLWPWLGLPLLLLGAAVLVRRRAAPPCCPSPRSRWCCCSSPTPGGRASRCRWRRSGCDRDRADRDRRRRRRVRQGAGGVARPALAGSRSRRGGGPGGAGRAAAGDPGRRLSARRSRSGRWGGCSTPSTPSSDAGARGRHRRGRPRAEPGPLRLPAVRPQLHPDGAAPGDGPPPETPGWSPRPAARWTGWRRHPAPVSDEREVRVWAPGG